MGSAFVRRSETRWFVPEISLVLFLLHHQFQNEHFVHRYALATEQSIWEKWVTSFVPRNLLRTIWRAYQWNIIYLIQFIRHFVLGKCVVTQVVKYVPCLPLNNYWGVLCQSLVNYKTHSPANKKIMLKNAFSEISNLISSDFLKKWTRIFAGSDSWTN